MIRPLYSKIILEVETEEDVTKGGIHIPATVKSKPYSTAKVVAIGDGILTPNGDLIPPKVSVGNRVLINPAATLEIVVDSNPYLVVEEQAIIGILEN